MYLLDDPAVLTPIRISRTVGDGAIRSIDITDNTIVGNGAVETVALVTRTLQSARVSGNVVTGVAGGMPFTDELLDNEIFGNSVRISVRALPRG